MNTVISQNGRYVSAKYDAPSETLAKIIDIAYQQLPTWSEDKDLSATAVLAAQAWQWCESHPCEAIKDLHFTHIAPTKNHRWSLHAGQIYSPACVIDESNLSEQALANTCFISDFSVAQLLRTTLNGQLRSLISTFRYNANQEIVVWDSHGSQPLTKLMATASERAQEVLLQAADYQLALCRTYKALAAAL